jgi:hypothetical protein
VFVAGQILTAAEMNVVSDQTVMSFAGTAARGSAIPSPSEGMMSYLEDVDRLQVYHTAWQDVQTGFTAGTAITATSTWTVPALRSPVVRVTVIGGGGGGGGSGGTDGDGGTGGTTTFSAGTNPSAAGGAGGLRTGATGTKDGTAGNASGNGAHGAIRAANDGTGGNGLGGSVTVAYVNLTGLSTVSVTVGVGGTAGIGSTAGGTGGRGQINVEYVAA